MPRFNFAFGNRYEQKRWRASIMLSTTTLMLLYYFFLSSYSSIVCHSHTHVLSIEKPQSTDESRNTFPHACTLARPLETHQHHVCVTCRFMLASEYFLLYLQLSLWIKPPDWTWAAVYWGHFTGIIELSFKKMAILFILKTSTSLLWMWKTLPWPTCLCLCLSLY